MEAFGGNLPVAGGDPFTSRRLQNLKRTFEPWDFILPTSFFFSSFLHASFCTKFECWPFLCYLCQLELHRGRPRLPFVTGSSPNTVTSSMTSGVLCFHVRIKGTFWEIFMFANRCLCSGSICRLFLFWIRRRVNDVFMISDFRYSAHRHIERKN